MISLFLHLLVLAYGTVNLCGSFKLVPLASTVLWFFATLVIMVRWLPDYVDRETSAGRVP